MDQAGHGYGIHPVYYRRENPTRQLLLDQERKVVMLFSEYLRQWILLKKVPFFDLSASGKAAMYNTFYKEQQTYDVLKPYLGYLLSTKHPSFREESEYRLSAISVRQLAEHVVACFVRNGMVVPYIATPKSVSTSLRESIRAIVIGPSPNRDNKQRALEHYLSSQRLDHIAIWQSHVPLV